MSDPQTEILLEKLVSVVKLLAKEVKNLVENERHKISIQDSLVLRAHQQRVDAIQEAISQLRTTDDKTLPKQD